LFGEEGRPEANQTLGNPMARSVTTEDDEKDDPFV